MVDIYRVAKRRGIYLALGTNPEGNSCFSIYQNNWIKMHYIFKERIQSLCKNLFLILARALPVILTFTSISTNSLGWISCVTGANQSSQKWILVALVNTNNH